MLVLLDNGHGINTLGKRSPIWPDGSQLFEWKFNREIVQGIHKELLSSGIQTIKIVTEDLDVSLGERVNRVNKLHKGDPTSILISVHANAGGGTGWEIFTSKGQTKSDILATHIFVEAHKILPKIRMRIDENDGDPDKEEDFYILKNTTCPAVLTENLFMDTESDCKFILSEEGRNQIIKLHVLGIKAYIKSLK